ncbi:MAG: YtxH domain-containing protein [Gemmatimonadales bacterium]|nr:YtxH domain-containing protein [Gemmatimonadales bacterium]
MSTDDREIEIESDDEVEEETPVRFTTTPRYSAGSFGLGLFVGALLGGMAALLLAPGSGRETRRHLRRRIRQAKEQVGDRLEELDDRVRSEIRRRRDR